jgi:hypothetical protein
MEKKERTLWTMALRMKTIKSLWLRETNRNRKSKALKMKMNSIMEAMIAWMMVNTLMKKRKNVKD